MYTSVDLVNDIQLRAAIPANQTTWSAPNLYTLIQDSIASKMLPLILKNIQDYYVCHTDYAITDNQSNYNIPSRAIAGALRLVEIIQNAGTNNEGHIPQERLNREDLYASYSGSYRFTVQKQGFYIDGLQVVLYPTPTMTVNTLRLTYISRPNSIVDPSVCAQITNINTGTNTVTVAVTPGFTTSSVLDIISAQPGFDWWAVGVSPTVVSSTTAGATNVTFTFASLPTYLNVGDWICPTGQSCVVQVPVELQPLLAQYVAVRVLSAQGDSQALQEAKEEQQELEEAALLLISPRTVGNPKRAVNARGIGRFV